MTTDILTVTATEANRSFARLLRAARDGACVTITVHGEAVAEIRAPGRFPEDRHENERKQASHDALIGHLKSQTPVVVEPWTRADLYERG